MTMDEGDDASLTLCRYEDGAPLTVQLTTQFDIQTSMLETALAKRLAMMEIDDELEDGYNENQENGSDLDPVQYQPRYDCHWLKAQKPCMPISTIFAIPEDSSHGSSMNPSLRITMYQRRNEGDIDGASCQSACTCQAPSVDWTRKELESKQPQSQESSSDTLNIKWVDLRKTQTTLTSKLTGENAIISSKAGALHFFRTLLGPTHDASPWQSECDPKFPAACVLVLSPNQCNDMFTSFRVSDASPSWFLHCITQLETLELSDGWIHNKYIEQSNSEEATIFVYKPIFRRPDMSVDHPLDNKATKPAGCLWETYYPLPGEDEKEDPTDDAQLEPEYKLQHPPYLNFYQDFEDCRGLFDPANLAIMKKEASNIPRWTPWPETHHYSSNSKTDTPWTVFPLCYCFPANDPEQRKWIPTTRNICPQTCEILERAAGMKLRTALFSQLSPNTTLEAHTGWADLANHVVRLHIPLIVPRQEAGLCGLWVDGCVTLHQEGKPSLFDDSKIHRAFNYCETESRIVLIVDLERPPYLPLGQSTGGHSDELDKFIAQMSSV